VEKPVPTSEVLYEADCDYEQGDPRIRDQYIAGKLVLRADEIRFVRRRWMKWEALMTYPKGSVGSARYFETGLILNVEDPEGAYTHGFDLHFRIGDKYRTKVFGKRIESVFGVSFIGEPK